jgi:hypothetical protein
VLGGSYHFYEDFFAAFKKMGLPLSPGKEGKEILTRR